MSRSGRVEKISQEFYNILDESVKCFENQKKNCSFPPTEGLIRSGISRGYYSIFLLLRGYMNLTYLKSADVHKKIIDKLKETYDRPDPADKIFRLREMRNRADYDTDEKITEWHLKEALSLVKRLSNEIKQL